MAATAILDFRNSQILLAEGRDASPCKFHQNLSICCEVIAIFQFLKMVAVCHLGFVCGTFGPPMKGNWRSLSLCKNLVAIDAVVLKI